MHGRQPRRQRVLSSTHALRCGGFVHTRAVGHFSSLGCSPKPSPSLSPRRSTFSPRLSSSLADWSSC
eukprot:3218062-Pyramimonas_sp.AAC.1